MERSHVFARNGVHAWSIITFFKESHFRDALACACAGQKSSCAVIVTFWVFPALSNRTNSVSQDEGKKKEEREDVEVTGRVGTDQR